VSSDPRPPKQTELTPREAEAGLKVALRLAEQWAISDAELAALLDVDAAEPDAWRSNGFDPAAYSDAAIQEMLTRVSHLMGIYRVLHDLFVDSSQADAWLKRPHEFGPLAGLSALRYMLDDGLERVRYVRRYLGGVLHG
jgi:hypothetical protein